MEESIVISGNGSGSDISEEGIQAGADAADMVTVKSVEGQLPDLSEMLRTYFGLERKDIKLYSPLTLAFIGDSVYEFIIRSYLVERGNCPLKSLNKEKVKYVSAKAQSELADRLISMLTEDELDILRRGRGTKTAHHAKNASPGDYHQATGLEALCGYLYLTGRFDRAVDLIVRGWELGTPVTEDVFTNKWQPATR